MVVVQAHYVLFQTYAIITISIKWARHECHIGLLNKLLGSMVQVQMV